MARPTFLGLPVELRLQIVKELNDSGDYVALHALLQVSVATRAEVQASVFEIDTHPRCPFEWNTSPHWSPEGLCGRTDSYRAKTLYKMIQQLPNLRNLRIELYPSQVSQFATALQGRRLLIDLTYHTSDTRDDAGHNLIFKLFQESRLLALHLYLDSDPPDEDETPFRSAQWDGLVGKLLAAPPPFHTLGVDIPCARTYKYRTAFAVKGARGLTAFRLGPRTFMGSMQDIVLRDSTIRSMTRIMDTTMLRELDLALAPDVAALAYLAAVDLRSLQSLCLTLHPKADASHAGPVLQNKPLLTKLTIRHLRHCENKDIMTFFPTNLVRLHIASDEQVGNERPIMYLEQDIHFLAMCCPRLVTLSIPIPRLAGPCLSAITAFKALRNLSVQLVVTDDISPIRCPCGYEIFACNEHKFYPHLHTAFHLCAIDHKLVYEIFQLSFAQNSSVCELVVTSCFNSYMGEMDPRGWMEALADTSRPHRMVGTVTGYRIQRLGPQLDGQVSRCFDLLAKLCSCAEDNIARISLCLYTLWPKLETYISGSSWTDETSDLCADVITSLPVKFPVYPYRPYRLLRHRKPKA